MAAGDPGEAETLDKGRFAGARWAGNADPDGAAGRRQQQGDQCLGSIAVVGSCRLDQRDGARQCSPLAAPDRGGEFRDSRSTGGFGLRRRFAPRSDRRLVSLRVR